MAVEPLKTDYQDAAFEGMRKYSMINNADGTVSFVDVTVYTVKEESYFGAKDVNGTNERVNETVGAIELTDEDIQEIYSELYPPE